MNQRRWVSKCIWVLVLFFFIAVTASCASKEEKKAKHYERAKQYIAKNELRKAVIELKNVVQIDPGDDAVYAELGDTYLKLKEGKEAFYAFSRAASINPDNLKAQLKVGQMLLLGRQTEEAKKKAELILQRSPNSVEALNLLSGVQLQEKDLDSAIKTLENAAALNPNHFNTQLSLGRLLLLKGEKEKAEKAYAKAISIDPTSNVPYVELSRLYASRGQMDQAEEELKKMLKVSGSTSQNLLVLALFYESTKRSDLAEKTYLQAVVAAPKQDITPLMNLSTFYARMKSYDKALAAVKKAAEIKKDDPNVMVNLAELQLDSNQVKDAEATLDGVLSKDKGNVGANLLKGRVLLLQKEFPGALERFDLVARENPRNPMAYYFRALAHIGKGENILAERDLLKAVELNPSLLDARLILAEFYVRGRNQELARQQIEACLRIAPQDIRVLMLQGNLKALEKDAAGAEKALKQVIQISPEYAPAYVQLGLLYNLLKRRADALASFKKALEKNPRQTDALAFLVGIFIADKKFDDALQVCEKQKDKVGENPANLALIDYLEGNTFLARGDSKKAEEHFKKAMETEPNLLAPYVALAEIYAREKKYDESIAGYEAVLSKNPKYLAGYMAIGTIYDLKGEGQKAEAYYRKALEIKRDFGPAANNLAWNLSERGGNIDEALTYAQIAKEQMPNSAAVMDTLGWVYLLKASYLNAIAEFQDSLARDPSNPVVNYHLGLAYHKNKEQAKAQEYFQKALELNPNFKGAEDARKILKELQG
jgi:tetratricopeptide (TPR) repeat protein